MSDPSRLNPPAPPPPPAPPLPPQRIANRAANALARFAPAFIAATRPTSTHAPRQVDQAERGQLLLPSSLPVSSKTTTHRTGIAIAAVDISPERSHAVVAGREILKTIRVNGEYCAEEFNLRSAIVNYASTHNATGGTLPSRLKDQLAATDVKWSHGEYDKTIATAASNGRIVIYDLHKAGVELVKMHEHNRQVHRLAFNPVRPAVLLSASSDATVRMWDLRLTTGDKGVMTCRSRQRFSGQSEAIRDVRWRPVEGYEFATGSDAGVIQRWDVRNPTAPLMKINAHERACTSVDWHPDGRHVLSAALDGFVKIYDFSSTERRQKPLRQVRAPHGIRNARWRPPCWSSEAQESGDLQSTQLVTSYNEIDPRIHLWDLKRPSLPFREFDKFDGPCSDMLWHSKDLLWTVGNEGMFLQTDIHFAPQVIQRRSMCSFDWNSSSGKLRYCAMKRPQRRGSGLDDETPDFLLISNGKDKGSAGEKPVGSRSFTDDGMDENLLSSSFRKRHNKAPSSRPSKSLGGTPPSAEDSAATMPLETSLEKCGRCEPSQTQILALVVLGACSDPLVQKLYAGSNQGLLQQHWKGSSTDLLGKMAYAFELNAKYGEMALMYRLAQSWRIAGFAVVEDLRTRAEVRVLRRIDEAQTKRKEAEARVEGEKADSDYQASLLDGKADKMKSHLFKGVIEGEVRNGSTEMDSTSQMTTPLAKPLPDSPLSTHAYQERASPLRNLPVNDDMEPLPPSILSDEPDPMTMDMSLLEDEDEDGSLFKSLNDQFNNRKRSHSTEESSLSPPLPPSIENMSSSNPSEDRSAPLPIERKADWRKEKAKTTRHESPNMQSFDKVADARRAALRDYKAPHRALLHFESPTENRLRAPFDRHDSSESFPMFSASTDSSHRAKSVGGSFPATDYSDGPEPILEPWEIEEVAHPNLTRSGPRPASDSGISGPSDDRPDSFMRVDPSNSTPSPTLQYNDAEPLRILRPHHPLRPLVESSPSNHLQHRAPFAIDEFHPSDFLPEEGDLHPSTGAGIIHKKPWSAPHIIKKLINFHTQSLSEIHLPAQLLSRIQPYLNPAHTLISFTQCESIFSDYHNVLLRLGLIIEAAELRKTVAHLYPSVYAYASNLEDTYINVFCHTCNKPFQNRKVNNYLCGTCGNKQAPCPVCLSVKPPSSWSLVEGSSRMKGTGLWAWCQGCGHGGHVACMERWLSNTEISEGGCASQGCLHDCGPGPRRQEKARLREEKEREKNRGRAKRDSWTVPESRAVERTRSVLVSQGGNSGSGSTTPTSSTVKEAKRVRLVIPNEEGGLVGAGSGPGPSASGGRETGRRSGLMRWGSDGAKERDARREKEKGLESPISKLSGMAASVD